MPRANPYRPAYDYNDEPSPSGALLFIGLIAAIVLVAFLWANYAPQPNLPGQVTGQVNPADPAQPFAPHTTSPSTGG
jgi:hypothetical protein